MTKRKKKSDNEALALMRALNEWKDAGGNVADVMLAIEYFMQARVPVIVRHALKS